MSMTKEKYLRKVLEAMAEGLDQFEQHTVGGCGCPTADKLVERFVAMLKNPSTATLTSLAHGLDSYADVVTGGNGLLFKGSTMRKCENHER